MESLRIERKDVYEIEVNDKGETIRFAMGDVTLPILFNAAYEEIDRVQGWLKGRIKTIQKQKDTKSKSSAITNNQKQILEARQKAFADMRKAMDKFLGEGGCQKIFGDENYLEMYNDLFDALSTKGEDGLSHFDRMKISGESIQKRIEAKYNTIKDQVI